MKRIYKTIVSLACLAMTFSSCQDWLDLYPSDEIKEEYLFSSGNGFRTALNGIYKKLSTFDLYGGNLTWGIVDAWGQVYYIGKAPTEGRGKAMFKIADFQFKNSELTPTTDAMWNAAWNIIANCNNLIQEAAVADSMLFYDRDLERRMILGEAIGLRAYMHFDLLRMYAPAPSRNPGERTFIPYVDKYPAYVNDRQTVEYCLKHVIADLKESQQIMYDIDGKTTKFSAKYRFDQGAPGELLFSMLRGYRLNYYAVTALLARAYLYAGMNNEAYAEAKKLIDEEDKTKFFAAVESSYTATNNFKSGNIKMYENIIFALYSPTDLVEWDSEFNHNGDGQLDEDKQYYLSWSRYMIEQIFGTDVEKDWRFLYQLEPKFYGDFYRSLKYYKQAESGIFGKVNNQTIPMIRMSEVYYIAAEAIYEQGDELKIKEAKKYLDKVRKGRGLGAADYELVKSKSDFVDMIVNDARREFSGEGQTLYMFKRLNKVITCDEGEIPMTDEHVVLPLPDSESNIK